LQIFVYAYARRDRLVGIVVPDFEKVKEWLKNPSLSQEVSGSLQTK
jgi:long-subunit acyl-CoA synthetase (AMP-forming)